MSRIGTIEKLNVASVLQRIETFTKTGLLVVKQDTHWVEFYCREGRLLCVGPIRTDATLGERLLQDAVISVQQLQETMLTIGNTVPSETRIALTLMDLDYVTREELRAWTAKKTEAVLSAVLSWSTGDLDFEENANAPSERLLVSLSITDLLATLLAKKTVLQVTPVIHNDAQESTTVAASHTNSAESDVSQTTTLFDSAQSLPEPSSSHTRPFITSAETLLPIVTNTINTGPVMPFVPHAQRQTPPPLPRVPITALPPKNINIEWQPDMVLVPADLSSLPEQHIQVTPDQWRLLTCVDGSRSLQDARDVLHMDVEDVCRVAGELVAGRIVQVVSQFGYEVQVFSQTSQNLQQPGLMNEPAASGYASMIPSPWSTILPVSDAMSQYSLTQETDSQWGNGGKVFIHGQGWVPQVQALMQPNPSIDSGVYTSVGGRR